MVQRERGYLLYNVKYLSDSYKYLSISINLFYLKYKKQKQSKFVFSFFDRNAPFIE